MGRRNGVSVSLSGDIIGDVERRRLVKCSTYCESLIGRSLGLEKMRT